MQRKPTDSGICIYDEDEDALDHEEIEIQGIKPYDPNPFEMVKTPEKLANTNKNSDFS